MSDAVIHWYLSDYADEVTPHVPTLEGAAYFLLHGKEGPDDPPSTDWGVPPLVKPGSIVSLSSLTMLADRRAVRGEDRDGKVCWEFIPPVPAGCEFMALRYGPGMGWDGDTICDPHGRETDEYLTEWAEGGDVIHDIAVGRNGDHQAVFHVVDGKPILHLLDPPAVTAEEIEASEGVQAELDLGGERHA